MRVVQMAVYCAAFACVGAAVTYYFDATFSSSKAVVIASSGFQILGALLVFLACQSPTLAASTITLAFLVKLWTIKVLRNLFSPLWNKTGMRPVEELESNAKTAADRSTVLKSSADRQQQQLHTRSSSRVDKVTPRSSPLPFKAQVSPDGKPGQPPQVQIQSKFLRQYCGVDNSKSGGGSTINGSSTNRSVNSRRASTSSSGDGNAMVADCVKRGQVYNEETKRLLQIGKGTYNKLLGSGWKVDKKLGVISPPKSKRKDK